MIPLRVSVKGFMSYRDEAEIAFEGAPLWVLAGPNGAGKSAIFDAITYALYGVHRGGAQNAKALINHDAKGLVVEFDFAIGDEAYRVKRTLGRKGTPTVQAFSLAGGEAEPVAETETKAGFDRWVLDTIGLDARTFTASVLLQQGRSEALLEADPKVRHEMLGQIIDLSAYERLHERADARYKAKRALAESLRAQLEAVGEVDDAEVAQLETEIAAATRQATEARELLDRMLVLEGNAARWAELNAERTEIERALAEASSLEAQAGEIERSAARFADLERVLPLFEKLVEVDGALARMPADLDAQLERAKQDVDAFTAARTALPWLQLASRARNAAAAAGERAVVAGEESERLAVALAERRAVAEKMARDLDAAVHAAEDAERRKTEAATLLREVQRRLARFEEVDGAAACSYCGQPLTAEHLEAERARLDRELAASEEAARDAGRVASSAVGRRDRLAGEAQQSVREVADLEQRHEAVVRNAAAARDERQRETERFEEAVAQIPAAYAPGSRGDGFPSKTDVAEAERRASALDARQGEYDSLLARVAERARLGERRLNAREAVNLMTAEMPDMRSEADALTADRLELLRAERLALAGAAETLARLEESRREGRERGGRLQNLNRELGRIPEEARRPLTEVEADKREAQARFDEADLRRRTAEQRRGALESRRERRAEVERQFHEATREEHLYRELARLLGRDRLQRHLLSQAESAIVANANEVLDRLSGGTLWLELRQEAEGVTAGKSPPKALDLVAYNSETGGDAIPVAFLSGSQRFRVAVSLALGIGRYAGQGGRRIESVIIDEGFGSLDRKGRREMIDELHALKSALDRIVLVSHQEEFADAFANQYQIELVDGTSRAKMAGSR